MSGEVGDPGDIAAPKDGVRAGNLSPGDLENARPARVGRQRLGKDLCRQGKAPRRGIDLGRLGLDQPLTM
jgi:hypothetical protein